MDLHQFSNSTDTYHEENGHSTNSANKSIGYLDVVVHQAREIQNICIYHKQDVYAKLSLTDNPDSARSTKVINGGGRNPVFDDCLRLDVKSIDASLKCEVWMLSRVKNYMEDQLLGFALVPLADVVVAEDGKLVRQEFSMSSTDIFHSPSGFVQLSLAYSGCSPEVIPISPPMGRSKVIGAEGEEKEGDKPELDKIEFPDLKVAKENQMMVSEYFGVPCKEIDMQSACLDKAENADNTDEEAGVRVVESFVKNIDAFRNESPLSSITTADSSFVSDPSTGTNAASPTDSLKDKSAEVVDGEADSSSGEQSHDKEVVKPVISINIEQMDTVVQQDIVDMYMKSMQQFTDSLSKMKLPMDLENGNGNGNGNVNGNGSTGENGTDLLNTEKKASPSTGTTPRVFYGSRAFF